MAEKDNSFQATVEALFKGMDSFITTKTVVGEAIHINDTILLPLVDVSFGVAAGAFQENAKSNGGGGMGGKISPSAVLVINKNGTVSTTINLPKSRDHPVFIRGTGQDSSRKTEEVNGIRMYRQNIWIKGKTIVEFLDSIEYL